VRKTSVFDSNIRKGIPASLDNDKVLECVAIVGAPHIITGDRRYMLPLGTSQGFPILTAADFLAGGEGHPT
jgi:hypothetical protein